MKQITHEQRHQIESYLKVGKSKGFIAIQLAVNRSSIYREVKRNSNKNNNGQEIRSQKYPYI